MRSADQVDESTHSFPSAAGIVAANGLVITAVTIYMGWSYSEAFFAYFSLSPLDLGLTPMEYGLRGVGVAGQDLLVILVLTLLVAVWIQRARPHVRDSETSLSANSRIVRAKEAVVRASGAASGAVHRVREGIARHRTGTGLGALVLGYGVGAPGDPTPVRTYATLGLVMVGVLLVTAPDGRGRVAWIRPLAVAIAFLSAIWAIGLYAENEGHARARKLAANLEKRTGATVYSQKRLGQLDDCGIRAKETGKWYGYPNLHEIVDRAGTHYLVRSGWIRGDCVIAITIPDDGSIMVSRKWIPPVPSHRR
ncbi:hypothetical protein [Nonomuraea turcica]|uniref:hypothetical protein n=1 Tax=Nonomuraea sp. G32 TaxID=3067274 RepID=UPI00273B4E44|nr:hypothetical protein [Nonomuraea sp. G32]MDP4507062.1 hypothetical protein [Nonomuraea sp. G32]